MAEWEPVPDGVDVTASPDYPEPPQMFEPRVDRRATEEPIGEVVARLRAALNENPETTWIQVGRRARKVLDLFEATARDCEAGTWPDDSDAERERARTETLGRVVRLLAAALDRPGGSDLPEATETAGG